MVLQDIYIYPVKSLGGIRLENSKVGIKGLQWDRRWMLVDENGLFMSQRAFAEMALLQVRLEEDGLRISHKHFSYLEHKVPFEPATNEFIDVTVWDDRLPAQIVDPAADHWFSKVLGKICRLVYMPPASDRHIKEKYAVNNETVSFADAMPYLLIGQASLDDLNEKLLEQVEMNRFRPNLVFSGGNPFEEDTWDLINIGECGFKITKPCARCVLITVNQDTAKKSKEPLKTLSTYRLKNKKVLFGQNMIALHTGEIKVGDKVEVVSTKS